MEESLKTSVRAEELLIKENIWFGRAPVSSALTEPTKVMNHILKQENFSWGCSSVGRVLV